MLSLGAAWVWALPRPFLFWNCLRACDRQHAIMDIDIDALRDDIRNFLVRNILDRDVHFYTNKQWAERGEKTGNGAIFSMTFEGAFYYLYNHPRTDHDVKLITEFHNIIAKYNLRYEMGFSWSLHFYQQEPANVAIQA